MTDNPNLALWNSVCDTDKAMVKPVAFGKRKFTAIDATYQRMRATALWGPYGSTWGLRNCQYGYINGPDGIPFECWIEAEFFWPDGLFEISTDWRWEKAGDTRLKIWTHCLKKALATLGFSADVHMGAFDDEKYDERAAGKPQDEKVEDVLTAIETAPSEEMLNKYMLKAQSYGLSSFYLSKIAYAIEARKTELQGDELFS